MSPSRTWRHRLAPALGLVALTLLALSAAGSFEGGRSPRDSGHARAAGGGAAARGGLGPAVGLPRAPGAGRLVGDTDARTPIAFSLLLRMPRERAFRRFVAAVVNPHLAEFHHYIGAAAIGRRYGLSAARLAQVRSRLEAAGVRVTAAYPQRVSLQVASTAGAVNRLLHVGLADFRDAQGRRYHRPLQDPVIPGSLRDAIAGVAGLSDRRLKVADAVPAAGLKPQDAALAYDVAPLRQMGLNGAGQTIAVFSNDTFQESDIAAYDHAVGLTNAPPVQRVEVRGTVPYAATPPDGSDAAEVDLDIETIRGMAPQAQIVNYEIPCCSDDMYSAAIDRIVADGRAGLVNMSYGQCEFTFASAAALAQFDRSFAAATARGITVFAASGDQGAYECQRVDPADRRLSVSYPASSPNVVAVGGTYLDLNQDGSYRGEAGWENVLSRAGGGGGNSAAFARPGWQAGTAGIDNRYTTSPPHREIPDVAAAADPDTGFFVFTQGRSTPIGGTSASAPFWTGSMALVRQLAQSQGISLGFAGPLLYRAAAQQPSPFHDVILGGDRFHVATPGWDFSTGLGSPDMAMLAHAMLAQLGGH